MKVCGTLVGTKWKTQKLSDYSFFMGNFSFRGVHTMPNKAETYAHSTDSWECCYKASATEFPQTSDTPCGQQ